MGCCGPPPRVGHEKSYQDRRVSDLDALTLPTRNRGCRDVFFLLLFVAFSGFLAYVLTSAALKGDPERLIHGYDDFGNVCGKQNKPIPGAPKSGRDKTDQPYIVYCSAVISECVLQTWRCIETCPSGYNLSVFNRCFKRDPPVNLLKDTADVTRDFFVDVGSDIVGSYKEIIILSFIAFGLACSVLIIFRFFAGFIIWCMLISACVGLIAGTSYLWYRWHKEHSGQGSDVQGSEANVKYWLAGAIASSVITVIVLLLVLVMRKRIQLVAVLFKEAGKAVGAMPLILFQPLLTFLLMAAIVCGWVVGLAYIQSAADVTVDKDDKVSFRLSKFFEGMRWYHLMALFWYSNFIMACQHVVIAGAVASWFFTREKKRLKNPILKSFSYLVCYSLGSVALGSLLVALLQMLRAMIRFLERRLKMHSEACTPFLKCCQCCLWCFQKFVVFINRNAYIEMAIYGTSFCESAREAFRLLSANILRVAAINSVGDFLLLMTKIGITGATASIGFQLTKGKDDLNYIWVPIVLSAVISYIICHCFFTVYEMTIDTLFLCFCEDCERNDGINRPFYMSKSLMTFVEKSKKAGYHRNKTKSMDDAHGS